MKNRIVLFAVILFWVMFGVNNSFAGSGSSIVNVYIWTNEIPSAVFSEFEKETGIHVNISYFGSNEVMYAKLAANPRVGYDVIMPSSYYIGRMRRQGMLHRLDKRVMPNLRYLPVKFAHAAFDPKGIYAVPYIWGVTGIAVDDRYWDPKTIQRWGDLWQPRFRSQLLLLNDVREVFNIALLTLGYSINDQNPEHIRQAYQKLRALLPNVRVFNSDATASIYADQDITVGMLWTGDAFNAHKINPHLHFIYPKDGFLIWVDCFAIPKYAPHLANAYKLLNFLMRPDIVRKVILWSGYSVANTRGMALLPRKLRDNRLLNPPASVLRRGQFQRYAGKMKPVYAHYWKLLKLG